MAVYCIPKMNFKKNTQHATEDRKRKKASSLPTLAFFLPPVPSLSSSLTSYPSILFHASSSFDLCFKIRGARLRVKDEITEDN